MTVADLSGADTAPLQQSRPEKLGRFFDLPLVGRDYWRAALGLSIRFPVQQTASLSGACAVVGRDFFLKNDP
jgi:hypothetical protein